MLWVLGYVGVIWTVEAVNTVVGHRLDDFGIVPRTAVGLKGIVFGPFLHVGFGHVGVFAWDAREDAKEANRLAQ